MVIKINSFMKLTFMSMEHRVSEAWAVYILSFGDSFLLIRWVPLFAYLSAGRWYTKITTAARCGSIDIIHVSEDNQNKTIIKFHQHLSQSKYYIKWLNHFPLTKSKTGGLFTLSLTPQTKFCYNHNTYIPCIMCPVTKNLNV